MPYKDDAIDTWYYRIRYELKSLKNIVYLRKYVLSIPSNIRKTAISWETMEQRIGKYDTTIIDNDALLLRTVLQGRSVEYKSSDFSLIEFAEKNLKLKPTSKLCAIKAHINPTFEKGDIESLINNYARSIRKNVERLHNKNSIDIFHLKFRPRYENHKMITNDIFAQLLLENDIMEVSSQSRENNLEFAELRNRVKLVYFGLADTCVLDKNKMKKYNKLGGNVP